ncbi:hypothetical protein HON52_01155 [Candidatus Uhrbacteria bacterium]|jgi:hypothetical protein|nr:hypothetical protein [Candidatus Uhrbacteria bacterium]
MGFFDALKRDAQRFLRDPLGKEFGKKEVPPAPVVPEPRRQGEPLQRVEGWEDQGSRREDVAAELKAARSAAMTARPGEMAGFQDDIKRLEAEFDSLRDTDEDALLENENVTFTPEYEARQAEEAKRELYAKMEAADKAKREHLAREQKLQAESRARSQEDRELAEKAAEDARYEAQFSPTPTARKNGLNVVDMSGIPVPPVSDEGPATQESLEGYDARRLALAQQALETARRQGMKQSDIAHLKSEVDRYGQRRSA